MEALKFYIIEKKQILRAKINQNPILHFASKKNLIKNRCNIYVILFAILVILSFINNQPKRVFANESFVRKINIKSYNIHQNANSNPTISYINQYKTILTNNYATTKFSGKVIIAASGSTEDIQKAVDLANPGDIVQIPEGIYDFDGTVIVKKGIHIRGAGRTKTILRKVENSPEKKTMFKFLINDNKPPAFSNIKLVDINGPYTERTEVNQTVGVAFYYGCWDLRVFNCEFEGFGVAGIITREFSGNDPQITWWKTRGVIYNNRFINCFRPGLGYGVHVGGANEKSWSIPLDLGSDYAVYIEDNYFSGCRHSIAGGMGARYVARYNLIERNRSSHGIDAHGKPSNYINERGTRKYEIYGNIIKNPWIEIYDPNGIAIRGGDGVIFNNIIEDMQVGISLRVDNCGEGGEWYPCTYPVIDQIRELYIWNNEFLNCYKQIAVDSVYQNLIQENRDYYLYERPGYTPYTYPHPLRNNEPSISVSKSSLKFNAVIDQDNPPSQTFHISNPGGDALDWSITDDADWLNCSPYSGIDDTDITVSVNSSGLSSGTYHATITVSSSHATNSPQNISVILSIANSPSPLSASASASTISGEAPLTVNFKGSASGGTSPYSYSWNFDDGQSSTAQSPSHTFNSAGNYTVTLNVIDSATATAADSLTINVQEKTSPLTASASGSPTSGQAPLSVSFTGSASGGTSPYSYTWDFGDGSTSSSQNPSHTYSSAGTFTVTLTVTDSNSSTATDSLTITATSPPAAEANLSISSLTGSPAPGSGGTTDPSPGSHSYAVGSSVQVKAEAKADYRFAKWSGDVSSSDLYQTQIAIIMDKDKSISAYFYTKCGDVNGDLSITPADAQAAFDIFLGKISNPTESELENADVNCDGTKTAPNVTPADAQAIFDKFLGKSNLPCSCSAASRASTLSGRIKQASNINLIINDIKANQGQEIVVPVIVDDAFNIKSFGFDLIFP